MAEAGGVDTSTYNQDAGGGALDSAKEFQSLAQGKTTLEQSKLKLINDRYNIINKEISTLANNPNATPEMLQKVGQQLVNQKLIPADMYATTLKEMPTDPSQVQPYLKRVLSRISSTQEAINQQYGVPGTLDTGQGIVPISTSATEGIRQTGNIIQKQMSPSELNQLETVPNQERGTNDITTRGQILNRLGGPNVVGGGQVAPMAPQANVAPTPRLPVAMPAAPQSNAGAARPSVGIPTPAPVDSIPGASPMLASGIDKLQKDQELSTSKMTAAKPLAKALSLVSGLITGQGTTPFNDVKAFAQNIGAISGNEPNPTAVYQEANKYLNQYISQNGSRSDADQALKEMSSPNIGKQISPALVKIIKNTIAQDRIQAARAQSFTGNPAEYGKHSSTFPQSQDERAYSIDLIAPKERNALLKEMLVTKKNTAEGKKFRQSLELADSLGLINSPEASVAPPATFTGVELGTPPARF